MDDIEITCTKCNVEKDESEFNKGPRGHHSYCRSCQKDYDRQRYKARAPLERLRSKTKRRNTRAANHAWIDEIKKQPCMDCGGSYHFAAMDFDHRDGEQKAFNVGNALGNGYSERTLRDEIAKCDLVCSNCHRVRTYNRRHNKSLRGVA